ncbi:MAG: hypothetical protein K2X47_18335 [Bdellovibrionales bacterium]|nr:hypothetical protein [Bdellovibrionales bacterium]
MSKSFVVPAEFENLADKIGEFMAYWGFKKVHGKIWTHLFTAETPLDASDLIKRLHISKALVSLTVKDLLQYEVIFETGKSERGTILYRANPNVTAVILNVIRGRERKLLAQIRAAHRDATNLSEADQSLLNLSPKGLQTLGTLIEEAETCLTHVLELNDLSLEPWKVFSEPTAAIPPVP